MLRRRDFATALAAAAGFIAAAAVRPPFAEAEPRVVRVTARRFAFGPQRITLKRGEPAILELESLDRLHGFDAPSLGLAGEFVPGQITRLPVTPDQAGRFAFTCNIFCGEGHEEMEGEILVTA